MAVLQRRQATALAGYEFIGIDVSKDTLHVSRRPLASESAKQAYSIIPNTAASIAELMSEVSKTSNGYYIFEATGVYSRRLEYHLSQHHAPFSKVSGLAVKNFSRSIGSLKKNDRRDALHIRQYGEDYELPQSRPLAAEKAERQRITQAIANMDKQLQNIDNQLHILDNEAFEMPEIRAAWRNVKETLVQERDKLRTQINTISDEKRQQGRELLKTIIGIGEVTSQMLMEATNGFEDFDKPKQVARFLGLIPVEDESGKGKKKKGICGTAYPKVRAKLYVAAGSAAQHNPICKQLYDRLRANGKSVKIARIAVAHKLVRIAHAVIKSGKPFDKNYHKIEPTE
jgi:transposase